MKATLVLLGDRFEIDLSSKSTKGPLEGALTRFCYASCSIPMHRPTILHRDKVVTRQLLSLLSLFEQLCLLFHWSRSDGCRGVVIPIEIFTDTTGLWRTVCVAASRFD